jgi:signal transduction histidine kinase
MRQLFQNLIGNALKFCRRDVPLRITVSGSWRKGLTDGHPMDPIGDRDAVTSSGAHCVITVADNGIGFADKYSEQIFGTFQRLHTRAAYEGTGIGLALCRSIVARHHGTLTAHGGPGVGATFIITLPARQSTGDVLLSATRHSK